jgi:hypothetical protein
MKQQQQQQHYLLTFVGGRANLHGYLMTYDRRDVDHAIRVMLSTAERGGLRFNPALGMVTRLTTGVDDIVRAIIAKHSVEAGRLMAEATDYHLSSMSMPEGDSDDLTLMALH